MNTKVESVGQAIELLQGIFSGQSDEGVGLHPPCSPRQVPCEGACIYCFKTTTEGRFWFDGLDGQKGEWMYAHENCEKLQTLKFEIHAHKKLEDSPDSRECQIIARIATSLADRACEENSVIIP